MPSVTQLLHAPSGYNVDVRPANSSPMAPADGFITNEPADMTQIHVTGPGHETVLWLRVPNRLGEKRISHLVQPMLDEIFGSHR